MTGQDKLEGFKCPKEELLKLWDMKTDLLNATAEEKAEATLATIAVENNVFALIPVFEKGFHRISTKASSRRI